MEMLFLACIVVACVAVVTAALIRALLLEIAEIKSQIKEFREYTSSQFHDLREGPLTSIVTDIRIMRDEAALKLVLADRLPEATK